MEPNDEILMAELLKTQLFIELGNVRHTELASPTDRHSPVREKNNVQERDRLIGLELQAR